MKFIQLCSIAFSSVFLLTACSDKEPPAALQNSANTERPVVATTTSLKEIGQKRSGDYVVTLFNESGVVKQGPNRFVLEVRNASDNQLVPVEGGIHIESVMEMPGHPSMVGSGAAVPADIPGRYEIGSDFAARAPIGDRTSSPSSRRMAGVWKLVVIFHPNQRVEFTADVE